MENDAVPVMPNGEEQEVANREWWREFFSGTSLHVIEQYGSSLVTQTEASVIEKLMRLQAGEAVLDVPCGQGRHSIELAKRGYRMTAADVGAHLVEKGRARAESRGVEIAWEVLDMRRLPWHEEFDAVFCFDASFGFFDDVGNEAFLRSAYRALKPGGRFLVHAPVLDTFLPRMKEREWERNGDTLTLDDRRWDFREGRMLLRTTYVRNGEVEERDLSLRVYTFREIQALLARAGFRDVRDHDAYTLKALSAETEMGIFVGHK